MSKLEPDEAHIWTDQQLKALEQRIASEYKKAADELSNQIHTYFNWFKERDAEQLKLLNVGEITQNQYTQWRLAQIGRGEHMEALRDRIAERMTHANEVTAAYINDTTPGIYSLNRNYAIYNIEQQVGSGIGLDLWDEQTIRRLILERPDLMPCYPPERAVNRGIDLAYGKRQITAQITTGILQGESIKHLADRLQINIPDMNRTSAVRAARTAVTSAQNAGRQDSYDAAVAMGIAMKKTWLATLDSRTRHFHAEADGQSVDVDKPFDVGGEAMMYPGDPNGSAHNTYNCRCTLIAEVSSVDTSDAKRRARNPVTDENELIADMTYSEWYAKKERQYGSSEIAVARKKTIHENTDKKQFQEYKQILGKNAPKSFEKFQELKYNSGEWEAFKAYKRAIQIGELTPLADFDFYQQVSREIDEKLVGITTSNGIKITGKSSHFIARTIGSVEQRRAGVSVQKSFHALTSNDAKILSKRVSPNGNVSQRFILADVEISINPDTGNLIQVNPFSRGKKS